MQRTAASTSTDRVRELRRRQREAGLKAVTVHVPADLVPAVRLCADILAGVDTDLKVRLTRSLLNLKVNHLAGQAAPVTAGEAAEASGRLLADQLAVMGRRSGA